MLHVLEALGIAELLKEGPTEVSELAPATGCRPPSLARLLRALTAFDVLAEDAPGCFRLTRKRVCRGTERGRGSPLMWDPVRHRQRSPRLGLASHSPIPLGVHRRSNK